MIQYDNDGFEGIIAVLLKKFLYKPFKGISIYSLACVFSFFPLEYYTKVCFSAEIESTNFSVCSHIFFFFIVVCDWPKITSKIVGT